MDIIYLAYSVNQLRQLSRVETHGNRIAIALPKDRIPYLDPETMKPKRGTNCDSAFICMSQDPYKLVAFDSVFKATGCAVYRRT